MNSDKIRKDRHQSQSSYDMTSSLGYDYIARGHSRELSRK